MTFHEYETYRKEEIHERLIMVGNREELRVATVQLAPLISGGTGFYGKVGPNVTYAAALLSALPVVLFFLWAQRWFINAIAGTGNDS